MSFAIVEDIEIVTGSEFMVVGVNALTGDGEEFLDSWVPRPYQDFTVVDVGRLVIPEACLQQLVADAKVNDLRVIETKAAV